MKMHFILFSFLVFINLIFYSTALDLKIRSPLTTEGYVFPKEVIVAKYEDVIFQLQKLPADFTECILTNPDTEMTYKIDSSSTSGRIVYWNPLDSATGCGVRVKNITTSDQGRWKLEAKNAQKKVFRSFIDVKIIETKFDDPIFYVREGEPAHLDVSSDAEYCEVKKLSIQNGKNIFDRCHIKIDVARKPLTLKWDSHTGLKGKTEEFIFQPKVFLSKEEFLVGVIYGKPKISMYCNLLNSHNVSFQYCRFLRADNKVGLRLSEGISNGKYSYYGNGVMKGECGLTIENPTSKDIDVWKCTVGIIANKTRMTKDSVIYLSKDKTKQYGIKYDDDVNDNGDNSDENRNFISGIGSTLTVNCKVNYKLKYCWFKHPNGTVFTVNKIIDKGVWRSAGDLNTGDCAMVINSTSSNDTGSWSCYLSSYYKVGMDEVKSFHVRISETSLVAIADKITTYMDNSVTIRCKATSSVKSLDYCRFTLPDDNGFNINEDIKNNEAIDDLYWYNGTTLLNGDCQVTINKISEKHIGKWKCAGQLENSDNLELYDYIQIELGEEGLSTASIGFITLGVIGVLVLLGTGIFYCKYKKKNNPEFEATSTRSSGDVIFFPPHLANVQQIITIPTESMNTVSLRTEPEETENNVPDEPMRRKMEINAQVHEEENLSSTEFQISSF